MPKAGFLGSLLAICHEIFAIDLALHLHNYHTPFYASIDTVIMHTCV